MSDLAALPAVAAPGTARQWSGEYMSKAAKVRRHFGLVVEAGRGTCLDATATTAAAPAHTRSAGTDILPPLLVWLFTKRGGKSSL